MALVAVVSLAGSSPPAPAPHATDSPAAPSVVEAVANVPAGVISAVGVPAGSTVVAPTVLHGQPSLRSDGKPWVVYVGGEYCPYCAALRWSIVQALSRFGRFEGLRQSFSSSADVYPSTPTFSFHGATYVSPYLSFSGVERFSDVAAPGGGYRTLDDLTSAERQVYTTYDAPPYAQDRGSFPFLDLAGRAVLDGADYDPGVLHGLTAEQIAARLHDPTDPVTVRVVGAATELTAALCAATGQRPGAVCTVPAVTRAQQRLHLAG